MGLRLILVYFDAGMSRTGDGFHRNRRIQEMVEGRIEKEGDEGLVVRGDFNAHLELLGAKEDDINGRMVLDWLDRYNLVLLNADKKCKGLFTWGRREQRSTIDLVLENHKMYEMCDLVRYRKGSWEKGEFLKKDPTSIRKLTQELGKVWVRGMGYERMWEELLLAQDKVLKSTFKKRVGERVGGKVKDAELLTHEIRDGIAERRRLKRKQRNSVGEDSLKWVREWWIQKVIVQKLVRQAKGDWESNEAWNIRNCGDKGKRLWQLINKLRGKVRG